MYKNLANTLFIGKNLVFLPSCHSTNQVAYDIIGKERVSDGTLVITSNQTAGRGQMGNSWEAAPNLNLTFSLIFHPRFLRANEQFLLNMAVSLAITDWLSAHTSFCKIKWPNDIFWKDKKLGGILIQNMLRGGQLEHTIVGIGMNINQKKFSVPSATSLTEVTGETFVLSELLDELAMHMEHRYLQLRGGGAGIHQEYLSRLYRFDQEHLFEDNGYFKATIVDVEPTGSLILQTAEGRRSYQFKEVSFVI